MRICESLAVCKHLKPPTTHPAPTRSKAFDEYKHKEHVFTPLKILMNVPDSGSVVFSE